MPLGDAPAAATELTLYRHENARRSARGRSRRSAPGAPACSGTSRRCWPCSSRCTASLFNRDWLGAGRLEAGPLLDGEWWRAVTPLTLHIELDSPRRQPRVRRVLRLLRRPVSRHGRRLARRAARGERRQRAERLGAVAGAPLDRRVDGRVRGARPAHGLHLAPRLPARHAVARPNRADRRGLRPARVHGHVGENTDLGAHLFGFIAGSRCGGLLGASCPTAWLQSTRVQRALRRARGAARRRRLDRRPYAPRAKTDGAGVTVSVQPNFKRCRCYGFGSAEVPMLRFRRTLTQLYAVPRGVRSASVELLAQMWKPTDPRRAATAASEATPAASARRAISSRACTSVESRACGCEQLVGQRRARSTTSMTTCSSD